MLPRRKKLIVSPVIVSDEELYRKSLVIACDFTNYVIKTLDLLDHPELPLSDFDAHMKALRSTAQANLGMLTAIEEKTRPDVSDDDIAWLKELFAKPDTRKESPLEQ